MDKNVFKELWKDKPLLIAVVVGVIAVIYILYKSNSANIPTASTPATNASSGSSMPGGTYVEESYYNNSPTTTTGTSSSMPIQVPITPTILSPAPKGSLGKNGAGKNDTNFWVYTIPAGATLTSVAEFAKWGTDFAKLANYRNNLQILQAAGVNTSNPYAPIPTGLKLSV